MYIYIDAISINNNIKQAINKAQNWVIRADLIWFN